MLVQSFSATAAPLSPTNDQNERIRIFEVSRWWYKCIKQFLYNMLTLDIKFWLRLPILQDNLSNKFLIDP